MIFGVVSASVLKDKAAKRAIINIARAPWEIQLVIFKETLVDLENYLDTGDLGKLTEKSLGIIRDDILEIIGRFRTLSSRLPPGSVGSVDGILEKLRDSRDFIQYAIDLFKQNKREKFYLNLRLARARLAESLKLFAPFGRPRRMV